MKTRNRRSFLFNGLFSIGAIAFLIVFALGQTQSPAPVPIGGPTSIFTTYDGTTLRKGEYTFSAAYSNFDPEVQTLHLASKLMAREVPYRVVLPADYATSKSRYPVIYLLHGLAGHYDNWTDKTKLSEFAANYNFIIVTPEGGDGWYTDNSTVPNDKYESYIIKELIPEVEAKFRTITDRNHRMIAGLSMGGYGAIKFGVKYPDRFSLVGSFSGALDAPLRGQKSEFLRPSIISVFGPEDSKTRKDNDVYGILRAMSPEQLKNIPFIYLDCGTEDSFFPINRDFDTLLVEKKIPHEFRELPGKHEWPYWDSQIQEFLRVADKQLKNY